MPEKTLRQRSSETAPSANLEPGHGKLIRRVVDDTLAIERVDVLWSNARIAIVVFRLDHSCLAVAA